MKKKMLFIISTIVFFCILAEIYGFERFHAPAVSSYLMTPAGVDYIRIGRTFVENPPQGALYDRAVRDEHGYTLYRESKEIGWVKIDSKTNKVVWIDIRNCPVHLENGVSIGASVQETIEKTGVSVNAHYFVDALPDLSFEYKGMVINLSNVELSYTGKKKIENNDINLKARDFKAIGQVVGFSSFAITD